MDEIQGDGRMSKSDLAGVPLGDTFSTADRLARAFVQGESEIKVQGKDIWRPNAAQFHERFLTHPWVREAMSEGWDGDLRRHMVAKAKRILLAGIQVNADAVVTTSGTLQGVTAGDLMPKERDTVDLWKFEAARNRSAAQWRDEVTEKYGSVDAFLSKTYGGKSSTFKKITPDKNFWNARYGRQG